MTKEAQSTKHADPKRTFLHVMQAVHRYIIVVFVLFLVGIYGFLAWRVVALDNTEPDEADITAQLKTAASPKIDEDVVNKIQQLQDNSVSVKALFDEARRNPFQE